MQKISAGRHDLLRVQQCLTRRGVALDIAGVLTFEVHRRLEEEMLGAAQKPLPAAGFAQVTLDQLSAYDVEVWRRAAESTRSGIRPGADGVRPLDAVLLAVMTEPRIAMLLLPHPTSSRGAAKAAATGSDEEPELKKNKTEKKVSGLKKELEAVKKKLAQAQGGGPGRAPPNADGKPPAPGKGGPRMPKQLFGMLLENSSGENICYGFNLKNRSAASPEGKCNKGRHVCGGCLASDHAFVDCPSAGAKS